MTRATPKNHRKILINSPNVLYFVKLYQLIDFYLLCITNKFFVLSNVIFSVNFKPLHQKSHSSEKGKSLEPSATQNTIRKLCIFNLKLHIIYVNNAKKFFVNKTQFNYTKNFVAKVSKQMKATSGNTKTRKIVHVCAFEINSCSCRSLWFCIQFFQPELQLLKLLVWSAIVVYDFLFEFGIGIFRDFQKENDPGLHAFKRRFVFSKLTIKLIKA